MAGLLWKWDWLFDWLRFRWSSEAQAPIWAIAIVDARVLYEPAEQADLVLETAASDGAYIDSLPPDLWERDKALLNEFFVNWLHFLLIGMKREPFREEKEWRLVYRDWDFGEPKYSFRSSHLGLIVP